MAIVAANALPGNTSVTDFSPIFVIYLALAQS